MMDGRVDLFAVGAVMFRLIAKRRIHEAKSEQELMCIPNFGRKSLDEVRERLEKNNMKLRGE